MVVVIINIIKMIVSSCHHHHYHQHRQQLSRSLTLFYRLTQHDYESIIPRLSTSLCSVHVIIIYTYIILLSLFKYHTSRLLWIVSLRFGSVKRLGLFQKLSSGRWATFFSDPSTPQDTHGVRAPRPPGQISALINPPHYGANMP